MHQNIHSPIHIQTPSAIESFYIRAVKRGFIKRAPKYVSFFIQHDHGADKIAFFFPLVPLNIRVRCTARVVVANAMENIFQVLESKRTKFFATRFGLILFVRWFSAGS